MGWVVAAIASASLVIDNIRPDGSEIVIALWGFNFVASLIFAWRELG